MWLRIGGRCRDGSQDWPAAELLLEPPAQTYLELSHVHGSTSENTRELPPTTYVHVMLCRASNVAASLACRPET